MFHLPELSPSSLLKTYRRYRTLRTHRVSVLPIAILMPHSACNCRCVMCDIWKGNANKKMLGEADVRHILVSLKKLGTERVLMSGGEALLNPLFFKLCEMLRSEKIRVTLLSTGLTLKKHAEQVAELIDEVIVSLDGDRETHDAIRQVDGAYEKMRAGIAAIRALRPRMKISGRCVIHRLNYTKWPAIVDAAKELSLDRISFLPADVTSEAFNRVQPWDEPRQASVLVPEKELGALNDILKNLIASHDTDLKKGFIAESADKLKQIPVYYAAHHGLCDFPAKSCNAPWVSAVVEADGAVRPCFFHDSIGNIRENALHELINSAESIEYRRALDVGKNETCRRCVCSLNLRAREHKF